MIELPLPKWSMEEARDKAYDAAIGNEVEYILKLRSGKEVL